MSMRSLSLVRALCWLLVLFASGVVGATGFHPASADPGFNNGGYFYDRFARPADHNFVAEHVVRLDNGDVVVAGRVSLPVPLAPNGPMYLGMVRYNAAGVRVVWGAGPDTDSTWYSRQYVVYPKGSGPRFLRIADIVAYGGYLYVMGDVQASVGQPARNVQIAVFGISDGEFRGIYNAFARSEDEYGAGLVPIDANFAGSRLLAVGTTVSADGVQRPTFRRFTLNYSTGALTLDTSIAPASDGYRDVVFPDAGFCASGACSAGAHTVAWYGGGFTPMGIYVGGTWLLDDGQTEYMVLRVDAAGGLDPTFNGVGMQRIDVFYGGQGFLYDVAVVQQDAFDPLHDEIYALGYGTGAGYVAKLRGDGSPDPVFGFTGRSVVFAGMERPRAMIVRGDTLVIAGQGSVYVGPGVPNLNEATISSIDRNIRGLSSGQPRYSSSFPALRPDASRYGDSVFYGLVSVPGGIVATGDVRDLASGGTLMFGTLGIRARPVFKDGFE